jgi:hypothetical protein
MAVVSIKPGHALYPFKIIGAAEGPVTTGERAAGHYRSAVEKVGGPPGTWVGNGAAERGFDDGDRVRWEDVEPLCGQFLGPRDPTGQIYLGRPPWVNIGLVTTCQAKLAACPVTAAEDRMRLLARARTECHGPVGLPYFDATLSVDKAISRVRASALAGAVEARHASGSRAGEDALAGVRLFAERRTRRAKEPRVLAALPGWEQAWRDAELGTLHDLARVIGHATPGASARTEACCDARAELARMAAQLASHGELTRAQRCATMAAGSRT